MTLPTIETVGLTKRFNSFVALDNLSLKIEGAKVVGFLGPNGAGKTTTLKMLTDMIFPTKGEAFLNGISVQKDRKRALAEAGVLIETPEIYPSLTPREALEMVADMRGYHTDRDRRITEVLAEVRMAEWADKKVGKFSKGMKQRINIAAALLTDPQVLLLDEPTTGLDPRGMSEVREIIRGLRKGNRLIFMSSHILSEVSDVCDEVALVDRGKLLFYDKLSEIATKFSSGRAPLEVAFARPILDEDVEQRIARLPEVASWERLSVDRLRLRVDGGLAAQERLFEELAALHLGVVSFRESSSALEETYMNLISRGD